MKCRCWKGEGRGRKKTERRASRWGQTTERTSTTFFCSCLLLLLLFLLLLLRRLTATVPINVCSSRYALNRQRHINDDASLVRPMSSWSTERAEAKRTMETEEKSLQGHRCISEKPSARADRPGISFAREKQRRDVENKSSSSALHLSTSTTKMKCNQLCCLFERVRWRRHLVLFQDKRSSSSSSCWHEMTITWLTCHERLDLFKTFRARRTRAKTMDDKRLFLLDWTWGEGDLSTFSSLHLQRTKKP